MDQQHHHHQHQLTNPKLKRLNTNDSAQDSIFSSCFPSRETSSSSVAALSPKALTSQSLSFTKIHDEEQPTTTSNSSSLASPGANGHGESPLSLDSLSLALSKIAQSNLQRHQTGLPKSANHLTTTPTNEPAVAHSKWCIVLVGLPACGKSSICKNLINESQEQFSPNKTDLIPDFKIDSFNAGNFRRKLSNFKSQTHDYFNFNNSEAKNQRETFAHIALDHLLNSLINSQINVGIFDATNSTRERREYIFDTIKEKKEKTGVDINTLILHVKCSDPRLWRYNVEGKTTGPDYINKGHDKAVEDFIQRAHLYQCAFEDITMEEIHHYDKTIYVQMDNAGKDYRLEKNGFEDDEDHHDVILAKLMNFVENYYEKYGKDYEDKVGKFWELNKDIKLMGL